MLYIRRTVSNGARAPLWQAEATMHADMTAAAQIAGRRQLGEQRVAVQARLGIRGGKGQELTNQVGREGACMLGGLPQSTNWLA